MPTSISENVLNRINPSTEVNNSTIYYQLQFSTLQTCVILIFQKLSCFSNLCWAHLKGTGVMLWYAVSREFAHIFLSLLPLLLCRCDGVIAFTSSVHSRQESSVWSMPGSDVDMHQVEQTSWSRDVAVEPDRLSLCVFLYRASMSYIQERSDHSTCRTDQLAGWFKTFDSWPASVMAISVGTSIAAIQ